MFNFRKFNRFILTCLVLSGLTVSGANAAILNIVDGQLVGASMVHVDGTLYDVEFVDGTCVGVFSGCDGAGDFDFDNQAVAHEAALALVSQVFIDGPNGLFDTDPELTVGCNISTRCDVVIPHTVTAGSQLFLSAISRNLEGTGGWGWVSMPNDLDTSIFDLKVFAQFTEVSAVPVPAAFWLFGTALVGLVGFNKRKAMSA